MSVSEGAPFATFELTRSGNIDQTTLGYVYIPWSSDEPLSGSYFATFAPGETTKSLDVPIRDNDYYYSPQVVSVTCGGSGPGTSSSTSLIKVTVVDDEPIPTVLAPSSVEVQETNASQDFTIPVAFDPPFRYPWQVSADLTYETASAQDVVLQSSDLSDGVVKLTIFGDTLMEEDETAKISFDGAAPRVIQLTILDDDRPPFPYAFDNDGYMFREDEPRPITVLRSGSLSESAGLTLRVLWQQTGRLLYQIPVVFAPGESAKDVDLPSFDDDVYTGERWATLELSSGGWIGARVPLYITDDESQPVLSIGDGSVLEGNLDAHTRLEIPVTLSVAIPTPISVNVTAAHGTTSPDDVVLVSQVVHIPAGERTGIAAYDVLGDIQPEQDETFQVTLAECCKGVVIMGRRTGTGTILNDDAVPTETLYRLPFSSTLFPDSVRWLTVPIKRLGRIDLPTRVTVVLTSSDARVFTPRTIWFAPNETEKEARFYIFDNFYSGNADVRVDLLDSGRVVQSATVQIIEAAPRPVVSLARGTAREGVDAAVPMTIKIEPRSSKPVTVHLHARSDTAWVPYDLPPYDATINIPPLTSSYTVNVPIKDDHEPEPTEEFRVEITSVDGATLGSFDYEWGVILDNDSMYVTGDYHGRVGVATSFTVEFPLPAPAQDLIEIATSESILDAPPTVVVPKGASNVTFEVMPRHAGIVTLKITPPNYLSGPWILTSLSVSSGTIPDWTLDPDTMHLAPGETAEIALPFEVPWYFGLVISSSDPGVADVGVYYVGNRYAAFVYGVSPGRADIRLPNGVIRNLSVVVADPPDPYTRKHSVRH